MTQSLLDLRVRLATMPLAMSSDAMLRVSALLAGGRFEAPPIESRRIAATKRGGPRGTPAGRAAVISVFGLLTQRPSFLEMFGLATSCDTVRAQFRAALSDPSIERVIFQFDSEGGLTEGIQELASEIRDARGVKPIIGIADSVCASAAFWLASACAELYATPSSVVGGVGVVAQHIDESGAMELAGVKMTLIAAGRFKTEGSPFAPLGNAARAEMQRHVDSIGSAFVRDVAAGRGVSAATVRAKFGEGRCLRAKQAQQAGMTDGTCTLDDLVQAKSRASIRASAYAGVPPTLAKAMRDLDLLQ